MSTLPVATKESLQQLNDTEPASKESLQQRNDTEPASKRLCTNKDVNTKTTKNTTLIESFSYWDNYHSRQAFGYDNPMDLDQAIFPVEEIVLQRMMKTRHGCKHHEGWWLNVEDGDKDNVMTHHDIFMIQTKCKYICVALRIALKSLHEPSMNWDKCCKQAIESIGLLEGKDYNKEGKTSVEMYRHTNSILTSLQRWHLKYCKNNE